MLHIAMLEENYICLCGADKTTLADPPVLCEEVRVKAKEVGGMKGKIGEWCPKCWVKWLDWFSGTNRTGRKVMD